MFQRNALGKVWKIYIWIITPKQSLTTLNAKVQKKVYHKILQSCSTFNINYASFKGRFCSFIMSIYVSY